MGSPSQQSAADDKKTGVAEAAPKAPGLLPTTPAHPAPKSRRKRWKLFEIDGYYRMRTDWFKNFNLGFPSGGFGGTPFPQALGCSPTGTNQPCDGSLSSANMRLRLEPTINLNEGTSVHVQADMLDNLVLGSTPYDQTLAGAYTVTPAVAPPLGAFNNGNQAPVTQGVNSDRPSIQIKRAWGEVAVPLGILKFGRMPNHWGMGILHNGGGADPINGGYDYDADYGDSVDRASFSLLIPGTNLRAMIASDWSMTRLVSNQTSANKGHEGHPYDLDDSDDINSWVGVISRMDSPQEFKDTIDRGEVAFNYGIYFEYKTQAWDYNLQGFQLGADTDSPTSTTSHYVPRGLKTYSPDLWAKVGVGQFTVEAELTAQLGSIDTLTDYTDAGVARADIRKFGGAGRVTWRGLENKLRLGVEGGFASGDQWDNVPQGATNIAFANQLGGPGDTTLSQFTFNRDYKIDMILWRHLIGAVSNAGYIKPFIQYDVTKAITFKVANITSFAVRPVATPGNSKMYGTEFNVDLGYGSGGLFAGLSYGVLFPFAALSHPADVADGAGQRFGYTDYTNAIPDTSNTGDAETAHVVQARAVLAF
ncbi:MAG: TIGR04551 family protein [Myxococcales bacterium]|nr:TIGR04551 family protein [Myxococcales bacterium]